MGRAVLLGHDHEYSDTYFRKAADYLGEEETNLLADAPDWWSHDLSACPFGELGFIYGWDGQKWHRAEYNTPDGFESVGLLDACGVNGLEHLREFAEEAPGLKGAPPDDAVLSALVAADGNVTDDLLETIVPGWDIGTGVTAARRFLEVAI